MWHKEVHLARSAAVQWKSPEINPLHCRRPLPSSVTLLLTSPAALAFYCQFAACFLFYCYQLTAAPYIPLK